jgi:hypothetical protein
LALEVLLPPWRRDRLRVLGTTKPSSSVPASPAEAADAGAEDDIEDARDRDLVRGVPGGVGDGRVAGVSPAVKGQKAADDEDSGGE